MDILDYFFSNIPLFAVSFVVIFLAIRNFPVRRRESIYFLIFTGIVIFLSIAVAHERYEASLGHVVTATFFTSSGYILRPILLYVFCLLANMNQKHGRMFYTLWGIPLILNLIIYLLPFFFKSEVLSTLVYSYQMQADGTAVFTRGGILNFFSHFISIIYLGLLVYVSTLRFHGKHRYDGMVILICVLFIFLTVTSEVFTGRNDLLNIVCEICALINYIFILTINSSRDVLTDLYDRRTYFEDVRRYRHQINGIIQLDMNGLKHLNDSYGHEVGDNALVEVAKIFNDSLEKETMFAYRLSGDEFIILMIHGKEEDLEKTANSIKEKVKGSTHSVALGYVFIPNDSSLSFEEALKKSEDLMYLDKERFYVDSNVERRVI